MIRGLIERTVKVFEWFPTEGIVADFDSIFGSEKIFTSAFDEPEEVKKAKSVYRELKDKIAQARKALISLSKKWKDRGTDRLPSDFPIGWLESSDVWDDIASGDSKVMGKWLDGIINY